MIHSWTGFQEPHQDLLIALAFIGMVVAPAIVATKSGTESTDESE